MAWRELAMALFRNSVEGCWNPDPLKDQTDEVCDLAYAAHHRFLKRLGGHPLEIIETELGGSNLACYCKLSESCHANILLEFANRRLA